ncbi:MAG TPA: hemerythrin domain-containing protein [Rubrivivax sp.]
MILFDSQLLTWHDGLLLGHGPMDAVHEEFVALVAALQRAPDASAAAALDALARHTSVHFAEEEAWMNDSAFPARDCHAAEHAAVLRSLAGVRRRVAQGDNEAARRLARALADWLPGHAEYLDAALAHWMSTRRLGGKPVVLRRHLPVNPHAQPTSPPRC